MKPIFTRIVLTATAVLTAATAHAYDFEVDGIYYNLLSATDRTVEVTYKEMGNNNYSGEIVIPNKVAYSNIEFVVTAVGDYAFNGSYELTGVKIPDTVIIIGNGAFFGCSKLKEVVLGNSIDLISSQAFYGCRSLKAIVIPPSVTVIGGGAFMYCTSLDSIVLPSSVSTVGRGIFEYCSSLTSVILPDGLAEIPTAMFLGCSSLTSVELPDGITTIEQELFTGCVSLKSIKIPLSVTLIDDSAFSSSGLESVVIPDNIKRISYGVFHNCVNLKEIVLGKSLECINTRALSGCTSLVSITSLNLDVPTCQTYVFENVNKFQCKVYVPEGSVDAYRAAEGWKEFLFIEPISESGVDEMGADADGVTAVEYYDLQGVRLDAPTKGVNIVVYSDGSRRKVVL